MQLFRCKRIIKPNKKIKQIRRKHKMKRVLCVLLAVLMVLGAAACAAPAAEPAAAQATAEPAAEPTAEPVSESVVVFTDPVLEKMVRAAMEKPEGDITLAEAAQVTELELQMESVDWSEPRISDISALRYFTGLTYLSLGWALQNNGLGVDLSPLSGLSKLDTLFLCCNDIRDITPLSSLTQLTSLWLFGCDGVSDLSALSGMVSLWDLWLQGCAISDVSPLSGLTELTRLYLGNNMITDISALSGMTKLTELNLAGNPILDYSPIEGIFANLTNPDFDLEPGNDVIAFDDPVLETRVCEALGLQNGGITFADVMDVTDLSIDNDWQEKFPEGSQISDITPLKYFVNLKYLGIQFHAIRDIKPLCGLTNLESLCLGGNPVQNVDALKNLTNLSNLTLWNCEAQDYSALTGLKQMRTLSIAYSRFSDLSLLSCMPELSELDVKRSGVADLSPLKDMTQLKKLWVEGCPIYDYAPLAEILPNLEETDYDQTSVDTEALARYPDDEVIVFNDPVLEERVRGQMGMPDGDITFADAKKVTELELGNDYQQEYPAGTQITTSTR